MKTAFRYSLPFLTTLILITQNFAEEPKVSSKELIIFKTQMKQMIKSRKLNEELINRKLEFWYGDCDSGAFSKSSYKEAARILEDIKKLNWQKAEDFIEANHFDVDLEKPYGRNPEYQGSRFYFEKRKNGKIYWTGYCELIQYK